MTYVGDGLTDIRWFSLLQNNGGYAFGLFDPTIEKSVKQALQHSFRTRRVLSMHAPLYGQTDELGGCRLIAALIEKPPPDWWLAWPEGRPDLIAQALGRCAE